MSYDPSTTLKSLRCPVLVIFGGKDVQVPPEGNAKAIRDALAESESEDYRVEIIPDLNHLMQTSTTGSPEEYGKIEETVSPILLEVIGDWTQERLID
ncbi:alpha/beta hydrolase [Candidatus Bipolaricaulota bacterium]|nr:alpha/beta hydrolase [Candidatus Bipolaricaulota bacterium]